VQDWEQQLAAAGYRVTAPRRAVIAVLAQASSPLLPQEILKRARSRHYDLGLVTVYRTLNVLAKLDLVRRVHRQDGCHGYLPASPGHHHAVICRGCGEAAEFPGADDLERLVDRVEVRTGYAISDHLLQLYGLCPNCSQEAH